MLQSTTGQHLGILPPSAVNVVPSDLLPNFPLIAFRPPTINTHLLKNAKNNIRFQRDSKHQFLHANAHLSPVHSSAVRVHDHGYRKPPSGLNNPMEPVVLQALHKLRNMEREKIRLNINPVNKGSLDKTSKNIHAAHNGNLNKPPVQSTTNNLRKIENTSLRSYVNHQHPLKTTKQHQLNHSPTVKNIPSRINQIHSNLPKTSSPHINNQAVQNIHQLQPIPVHTPDLQPEINPLRNYVDEKPVEQEKNFKNPGQLSYSYQNSNSYHPTSMPHLNYAHAPYNQYPMGYQYLPSAGYGNLYYQGSVTLGGTPTPIVSTTPYVTPVNVPYVNPTTPKPEFRNYVQRKQITIPPALVPERRKKKGSNENLKTINNPTTILQKETLGYDTTAQGIYPPNYPYAGPSYTTQVPYEYASYPSSTPYSPTNAYNSPVYPHNYPFYTTGYPIVAQYPSHLPFEEARTFNTRLLEQSDLPYNNNNDHKALDDGSYSPHTHNIKARSPVPSNIDNKRSNFPHESILNAAKPMNQKLPNHGHSQLYENRIQNNYNLNRNQNTQVPISNQKEHHKNPNKNIIKNPEIVTPIGKNARYRPTPQTFRQNHEKKDNSFKTLRLPLPNPRKNYKTIHRVPNQKYENNVSSTEPPNITPMSYPKVNIPIPSPALSGLPFFINGQERLGPFVIKSIE